MESGVQFVAADMPQVNSLTIHIMAHSPNTRPVPFGAHQGGMAALKARATKLGNPRWKESIDKARRARIQKITGPSPAVVDMIQQNASTIRQSPRDRHEVERIGPSNASRRPLARQ
ncbi:MAG: hypothetical protein JO033_11180 [Acidobacteriaceae bacterium]|nr:hypothetical protein [Acidobacteriaceae bacterium]MBV9502725.1 hypothetical protein [Acidobacteriaceae bacterium]